MAIVSNLTYNVNNLPYSNSDSNNSSYVSGRTHQFTFQGFNGGATRDNLILNIYFYDRSARYYTTSVNYSIKSGSNTLGSGTVSDTVNKNITLSSNANLISSFTCSASDVDSYYTQNAGYTFKTEVSSSNTKVSKNLGSLILNNNQATISTSIGYLSYGYYTFVAPSDGTYTLTATEVIVTFSASN